ncbi:ankyrin repeat domain-containing protein [Mesobacillus jeotgali]|uniref:ankyrin repeat domain-containing protein n=1 Tax=Mesobacillus jeotgali TaxID=129985 RepID=UPI0009A76BB7|nr:ankyrin repeat domain-containing protein [Mesobacillus jeotgali]
MQKLLTKEELMDLGFKKTRFGGFETIFGGISFTLIFNPIHKSYEILWSIVSARRVIEGQKLLPQHTTIKTIIIELARINDEYYDFINCKNKEEAEKMVVKRGFEVDESTFIAAIEHNYPNLLKLLCIAEIQPNKVYIHGYDSLQAAISYYKYYKDPSRLGIVQILVNNSNFDEINYYEHALEDINLLRVLLEGNIDTDGKMKIEALHQCVGLDKYDPTHLLLNVGVNPNIKDNGNKYLINKAILNDNIDIVRLLLKSGADPSTVNIDIRYTPESILLLLFQYGMPLKDDQVSTILNRIDSNLNSTEELICYLIKYGYTKKYIFEKNSSVLLGRVSDLLLTDAIKAIEMNLYWDEYLILTMFQTLYPEIQKDTQIAIIRLLLSEYRDKKSVILSANRNEKIQLIFKAVNLHDELKNYTLSIFLENLYFYHKEFLFPENEEDLENTRGFWESIEIDTSDEEEKSVRTLIRRLSKYVPWIPWRYYLYEYTGSDEPITWPEIRVPYYFSGIAGEVYQAYKSTNQLENVED